MNTVEEFVNSRLANFSKIVNRTKSASLVNSMRPVCIDNELEANEEFKENNDIEILIDDV